MVSYLDDGHTIYFAQRAGDAINEVQGCAVEVVIDLRGAFGSYNFCFGTDVCAFA